jgi:hypothetical protein
MEKRGNAEEKYAQEAKKPGLVEASGDGKMRGMRAGHDVLLSFPVEAGKRSVR